MLAQPAPPPLTAQDENEIRSAIQRQTKQDNERGAGEVWSERGPIAYRVRHMEAVLPDVATADAEGWHVGPFTERRLYLFLVARSQGRWAVVRRIAVCPGEAPATLRPVTR